MYTCAACGIVERVVQVPERSSLSEDVVHWAREIMARAVGEDHARASPFCISTTCDIKIPIAGADNFIVGQARRQ
jgi:hypothetical protein